MRFGTLVISSNNIFSLNASIFSFSHPEILQQLLYFDQKEYLCVLKKRKTDKTEKEMKGGKRKQKTVVLNDNMEKKCAVIGKDDRFLNGYNKFRMIIPTCIFFVKCSMSNSYFLDSILIQPIHSCYNAATCAKLFF